MAPLLWMALQAATLDGRSIHYTNYGTGAEAVVLVHGWTCDESFWKYQTPALRKRYRVITIDLPGHGRSQAPPEIAMTMDHFAHAVNAVLAEAGVARAVLVGHSMGTPVIRQFARIYPGKTRALVLMDGTIFEPAQAAARQGRGAIYRGEAGLEARRRAVRSYFGAATTPVLREHIERVMTAASETTAVGAINGMLSLDVWRDERPVEVPVLGVYAGGNAVAADYLRRLFPQLEFHKVPGAGHFLMMEKPREVNALLLDFLRRLPPSSWPKRQGLAKVRLVAPGIQAGAIAVAETSEIRALRRSSET
jgi:pimeloyl-ACP methyl ester carboxylesterase